MKNVLIRIKTTQIAGGSHDRDRMEFTTVGRCFMRDGTTVLRYEEGSMLSDAAHPVQTMLKIRGEQVVLQRTGGQSTRLVIEKGVRHSSFYNTPYGDFTIGIFGESVQNALASDGRLYLRYTLDANAGLVSRNELEISIKEV